MDALRYFRKIVLKKYIKVKIVYVFYKRLKWRFIKKCNRFPPPKCKLN